MERTVALPLWGLWLLGALAAVALLDRLLVPSVRWVLRRRVNAAIERLNARLRLHIQPFKLTRRAVLVDRLAFDPKVLEAVEARAKETGEPRAALQAQVARYAAEIVPAFKPYAYFQVGYRIARWVARLLYRVRVGYQDDEGLSRVDPSASVVFVVNHRSNMDYVLVAYLAAERTALSYAVGEWAQVWPLQTLIRSMGAYFIRRSSKDPLYRRVLERYVQMSTEAGVVQAVFPEGGLSRDGAMRPPRLGLVDYMLRTFDPAGPRDLVFVPVGIAYDRVLEDRALLAEAAGEAPRGVLSTTATATRFGLRQARPLGAWGAGTGSATPASTSARPSRCGPGRPRAAWTGGRWAGPGAPSGSASWAPSSWRRWRGWSRSCRCRCSARRSWSRRTSRAARVGPGAR